MTSLRSDVQYSYFNELWSFPKELWSRSAFSEVFKTLLDSLEVLGFTLMTPYAQSSYFTELWSPPKDLCGRQKIRRFSKRSVDPPSGLWSRPDSSETFKTFLGSPEGLGFTLMTLYVQWSYITELWSSPKDLRSSPRDL
ncbi:unnamed protein product [Bursaphelenchus xylophilus]|uniref:(pine wood nematode) hypothetical protein n=1 Tax=Bursaphelenchus xylophilus TaxID=6326 RepID=A0A1I7S8M1_BURXY|nr:unnamed protein product [Bursaphelenchus xylophilus]CAG9089508.1 unnamed protein product [Bursaphelenchus xylophilus]